MFSDTQTRLSWKQRGLFVTLGLGLALGQAPFNLSFGYFLILPFFFWLLQQFPNGRMGFGAGWWMGVGYFALLFTWVIEPFLVDAAVTGWMAPIALAAMASGFALFYAVPTYLACRIWFQHPSRIFGFIFLFITAEYIRSYLWTGFPWGHLSYAFIDMPFIQITSVFGIHLSLSIFLLALSLPVTLGLRPRDGAVWMLVIFGLLSVFGGIRQLGEHPNHSSDTSVRLVQPNAAQHLKWRPEYRERFYARQLLYTQAGVTDRPDIIIWPETAIYYPYKDGSPELQQIADAAGPSSSVLAGIVRWTDSTPRNTAIYLDPAGGISAIYDKHHLVPFGEFVPFGEQLSGLGLRPLVDTVANFSAGAGPQVIKGGNVPDFLPLICYEAIFPHNTMMDGTRAEWIVHITNDAWFGTFSGPFQHLAQTRMRAIEQGLPIARVANTGISAMIDPFGRITHRIELGEENWMDVKLPAPLPKTFYAIWGDWPLVLVLALLLAFALFPQGFIRNSTDNS